MGRQNFDSNLVCSSSSIALLQERFRQLQRVREKREEREEVLKLFSEADERINYSSSSSSSSTLLFQRSKMSSQPEKRTVPVRQQQQPHLHDSLALGLNLQCRHTGTVAPLTNLWNSGAATDVVSKPKNFFDNSDVDTSLHL